MGLTRPRAYQIFDIDYKQSVRVISLSDVTLSGGAPTVVDGVTLSNGDRILVAGQSTGSQNGLYQVSVLGTGSNGTWIRSVDGNETGEIDAGMIVMVTEGDVYKDTQWKLTTNDPIIIGTTALTFEQNSAFAFGNIYANGTAVLADIVGDTVTFTPANNLIITGNASSDTITFEVSQSPSFTGTLDVTGNISGGNLSTLGTITGSGNITGGNLVTVGQANVGTLIVNGGSTFTGNLLPSANVTYNLGSPTQRWNEIFLAANTIDIGGATISADLVTGSLILTGPDGAEFILTGSDADNALGAFGFVSAGNTEPATSTTTGAITSAGGLGVAGNIYAGGLVEVTGNITGGNITTAGNVTAGYFFGNVSQASGIFATKIFNGNSEANIVSSGGNLAISIGGTSNIVVISSAGLETTGTLTATGNVTGGNITTAGNINQSAGNLSITTVGVEQIRIINTSANRPLEIRGGQSGSSGARVGVSNEALDFYTSGGYSVFFSTNGPRSAIQMAVTPTTSANSYITITGSTSASPTIGVAGTPSNANLLLSPKGTGNVVTGANLSVTGNITGGNISATNIAGTLETASQPNITSVGTLTSLDVSGNAVIGGDLTVNGNTIYVNITDLNVQDPIISLGRGENNAPLTSDDGKDRGEQLWYYTSAEKSAFIGYDNSADKLIAALDVSISNEIVTVNSYGNFVVGGLEAATGSFTGNVDTGNISGTTGTFTNVAGTLTTAAQPNVTSVGTLTSLDVTGNVTGGNLVTAGQVVATGNISGDHLVAAANVEIRSRGQLVLQDTDNSHYVSLRAPSVTTGNVVLTLPNGTGNANQVLSTNGAGTLSWIDQSGGGGGGGTSFTNTTVSPVPGFDGNFDLSYNYAQTVQEVPFESGGTDAFGVSLGEIYNMMDPQGEVLDPVDFGVLT